MVVSFLFSVIERYFIDPRLFVNVTFRDERHMVGLQRQLAGGEDPKPGNRHTERRHPPPRGADLATLSRTLPTCGISLWSHCFNEPVKIFLHSVRSCFIGILHIPKKIECSWFWSSVYLELMKVVKEYWTVSDEHEEKPSPRVIWGSFLIIHYFMFLLHFKYFCSFNFLLLSLYLSFNALHLLV